MIGILHERFHPSFCAGDSCHLIIIAGVRLRRSLHSVGELLYTIESLESNKPRVLWYIHADG